MSQTSSAPNGAWKCSFPAFLGNYDRPTDQRHVVTDQPKIDGHEGS